MYAAISGLKVHQTMLDVTANDIANVNTIGYKAARTTFKDSLAQLQRGASGTSATQGGANAVQVGLGVQLNSIDNLMTTGALQSTGNVLDVAIQGPGWFRIGTANTTVTPPTIDAGSTQYTRAGNFTRNKDGYLVTQEGYYVLGQDPTSATPTADSLIQIPNDATNVSIGQDGSVSWDPAGGGARQSRYLTLANFANESGLQRVASNRWVATNSSGPEGTPGRPGTPGFSTVASGTTEMSNVDLAQEFTNMISAQRGFQANSRVISTADQMLQDLVNLNR
jgi:flagellar hook protein FlgE